MAALLRSRLMMKFASSASTLVVRTTGCRAGYTKENRVLAVDEALPMWLGKDSLLS